MSSIITSEILCDDLTKYFSEAAKNDFKFQQGFECLKSGRVSNALIYFSTSCSSVAFTHGVARESAKKETVDEFLAPSEITHIYNAYAIAFIYATGIGGEKVDYNYAERVLRKFVTDASRDDACVWWLYGFILDAGYERAGDISLPYYAAASRKGHAVADYNIGTNFIPKEQRLYMYLRAVNGSSINIHWKISEIYKHCDDLKNKALAVRHYCLGGEELNATCLLSTLKSNQQIMKFLEDAQADPTHGWKFDNTDGIYIEILKKIDKECGPADEHIFRQWDEDKAAALIAQKEKYEKTICTPSASAQAPTQTTPANDGIVEQVVYLNDPDGVAAALTELPRDVKLKLMTALLESLV